MRQTLKPRCNFVAVLGSILLLTCICSPALAQQVPTPADLQQMYDGKQYKICLQQIARALALKGDAARGYDRYKLLLLRGECLMRLYDRPTSLTAFVAAQASPDTTTALTARANVVLLQKTSGWDYVPPGGTSIDISEPESRKKAMAALFAVAFKDAHDDMQTAISSPSLTPSFDVLPKLKDMTALEMTATGQDTEIRPVLMTLGEHVRGLIDNALNDVQGQITAIQNKANDPVMVAAGGPWWVAGARRGLETPDRQALRQVGVTLTQIYNAAMQGRTTSEALKGKTDLWEALVKRSSDLVSQANQVLDAE